VTSSISETRTANLPNLKIANAQMEATRNVTVAQQQPVEVEVEEVGDEAVFVVGIEALGGGADISCTPLHLNDRTSNDKKHFLFPSRHKQTR
jgi:hypothetical protein